MKNKFFTYRRLVSLFMTLVMISTLLSGLVHVTYASERTYYTDDSKYVSENIVRFETNGGDYISDQRVLKGDRVSKPADPEKNGYEFAGWYEDRQLTDSFDFWTVIEEDITLYAKWNIKEYKITYSIGDNAWYPDASRNPENYTIETKSFNLINPVREGYEFKGWTGSNGSYPEKNVSVVNGSYGDKNFTANWEPIVYNITYELEGGRLDQSNYSTYTIETGSFTLINPSKEGYEFKGWTGSNGSYPEKNVYIGRGTMGDKSYTAHFEPIVYTIFYELNGGRLERSNVETYTIESSTITLRNPTKKGYTFKGWILNDETTPYKMVEIQKGSIGNRVYTAIWQSTEFKITYDLKGGKLKKSNPTYYYEDTPTFTLNNPKKDGYKFKGWTGSNGNTPKKEVTIKEGSTGNKEFKAHWDPKEYDISYDLAGGKVSYNPSTYTIKSKTIDLNKPEKSGYNFKGWTGSNGKTPERSVSIYNGSTGDKNYKAHWEPVLFSISYELNGGYVAQGNKEKYSVETDTFMLNNPIRDGYVFAGWTGSNGNIPNLNVSVSKGSIGALVFKANWVQTKQKTNYNYDTTKKQEETKPAMAITEEEPAKEEPVKAKETVESKQTDKTKETVEPEKTVKPKETVEPEKTAKPKETVEPEKTDKPKETVKPEKTAKPKETVKPEEPKEEDEIVIEWVKPDEKAKKEEVATKKEAPANEKSAMVLIKNEDSIDSRIAYNNPKLFLKAMVEVSNKSTKTTVTLKWNKVKGAKSYVIYGSKCGVNKQPEKVATLEDGDTYIIRKLKWNDEYKFKVVALGTSGEKITESLGVHFIAGRLNASGLANIKKVKASNVSLKEGKSKKIRAIVIPTIKANGVIGREHTGDLFRYVCIDQDIAKVDDKGNVTGLQKGIARIFVIAPNGERKKIKVRVK